MKRCPTCHRTFTDETLSFCLDDGTPLLDQSGGGPQSYGSNINIKPPQTLGNAPAPTIAYRPGTMPGNQATPAWQTAASQPPRKRKIWPWLLGGVGLLAVLGVGFIVLIVALASMDTNSNNSRSNSNNANNSNLRMSNRNNSNANTNSNNSAASQNESNTSNVSNTSTNSAPAYAKGDVQITGINMARDDGKGGAGESVDTFSPSDRIVYCVVHLNKLKAGTTVKFTWYAVDAGDAKNKLIQELNYTTGAFENIVTAHLTLPQDWPTGDYKVDVSVNDGPIRSVEYSVE
jgi:hypothetical protein